ncbi:MAG: hypothetical protein KAJ51_02585 [Thermoplasmata archaeon]|nr:hypothetical protein [Thermoplasmata archaeon]
MKRSKKIIATAVCSLLIISGFYIAFIISNETEQVEHESLVPSNIWEYQIQKNQPSTALAVSLRQKNWQALSAACIIPAYIDRNSATPIFFNDGSEMHVIDIPHEEISIDELGNDPATATENIAKKYWSRSEIAIVANEYEHVLWSIPIASYLTAPILANPTQATLQNLGVECLITIGDYKAVSGIPTIINLDSKENVWRFQLDLYNTKGQKCNYIVITNPEDANSAPSPDIKWRYLSLASAPLAAYRNALIQTGGYTANRTSIDKIAKGMKQDDVTYNQLKPYFERVKKDTYNAEKFLMDNSHNPEFLAIVGGSYAIPDYIFDFHISYLYWSAKVDYVFSTSPYGDLEDKVDYIEYPYQEVGVGRIIGHSILDASLQLVRNFFYEDFLTNGIYGSLSYTGWESKAGVVEGHRVNQPNEGGPPVTPDNPYKPAGDIYNIFNSAGLQSTYYLPRNVTDIADNNLPINEILDRALNSSMVLINGHGGVPGKQTLLEIGIDRELGTEYLYTIDGYEIQQRAIAPALVYIIGCDTGSIAFDFDSKDEYLTLGFIHAGAVAYIAPETYQTICYWDNAPDGPEASVAIYFFENVLEHDMPIGTALVDAKWKAYEVWQNASSIQDDLGPLTVKLYGDPAFKPYKASTRDTDTKGAAQAHDEPPIKTTRQIEFDKYQGEPLNLLWDETQTITGVAEIGNLTIKNFGRLVVEDADLTIKGTIEISEFATLFVRDSKITVEPPPLPLNCSVLQFADNALIRFYDSELTVHQPPTNTATPFILAEDTSTFTFSNGEMAFELPSIPREPGGAHDILEWVSGTAGVLMLADDAVWRIDNTDIEINLNYKYIDGLNVLMGAWYFGTLEGDVNLNLDKVDLKYETTKYLFETINGRLEIINSVIEGGMLSAGLSESIIVNSTIAGEVTVTDQSSASIRDSRIIKNIITGMFSESEITPAPSIEIINSVIDMGLISSGFSEVNIINTTIIEGITLFENSSVTVLETKINGLVVIEDYASTDIINSTIKSVTLKEKGQIYIENNRQEIKLITLFYDCNATITLINCQLQRLTIYPGVVLESSLTNSSITTLRTYWNITTNFELVESEIIEIINTGDNNHFSFSLKNSSIPPAPIGTKITTHIKYFLEVYVLVNNNPVATKVEVYDEDELAFEGVTDNNGFIRFLPVNKIISSEGDFTFENYYVNTTYMGFADAKTVKLDGYREVIFNFIDTNPPIITDIDYDPKLWNSEWQITIQATITDEDVEAIANATIVYSTNDGKTWKEVPMNYLGQDKYQGIIPGQSLGTGVEFYIVANDRAGNQQQSAVEGFNVGSETIILIYILIIVLFSILLVIALRLYRKRTALKKYYTKGNNTTNNKLLQQKQLDKKSEG